MNRGDPGDDLEEKGYSESLGIRNWMGTIKDMIDIWTVKGICMRS